MKIFLLTVTILFLISRIKNTPGMLSKKLYFKKVEKAIESNNKSFNGKSDDEVIVYSVGGMPVEDVAWGCSVYRRALKEGIGIRLNLWDKPEMA